MHGDLSKLGSSGVDKLYRYGVLWRAPYLYMGGLGAMLSVGSRDEAPGYMELGYETWSIPVFE